MFSNPSNFFFKGWPVATDRSFFVERKSIKKCSCNNVTCPTTFASDFASLSLQWLHPFGTWRHKRKRLFRQNRLHKALDSNHNTLFSWIAEYIYGVHGYSTRYQSFWTTPCEAMVKTAWKQTKVPSLSIMSSSILLMAEILHHLGCMKPYKQWDKLPTSTGAGFQPSTVVFHNFWMAHDQPYSSFEMCGLGSRPLMLSFGSWMRRNATSMVTICLLVPWRLLQLPCLYRSRAHCY